MTHDVSSLLLQNCDTLTFRERVGSGPVVDRCESAGARARVATDAGPVVTCQLSEKDCDNPMEIPSDSSPMFKEVDSSKVLPTARESVTVATMDAVSDAAQFCRGKYVSGRKYRNAIIRVSLRHT